MTETNTLKQEVKSLLENEFSEYCEDMFHDNFGFQASKWSSSEELEAQALLKQQDIVVTTADNYGGEGMGEEYWTIYNFSRGNEEVYVKFDGSYQSYDGSTYDCWFFVTPKQVTVTKYFREQQ